MGSLQLQAAAWVELDKRPGQRSSQRLFLEDLQSTPSISVPPPALETCPVHHFIMENGPMLGQGHPLVASSNLGLHLCWLHKLSTFPETYENLESTAVFCSPKVVPIISAFINSFHALQWITIKKVRRKMCGWFNFLKHKPSK